MALSMPPHQQEQEEEEQDASDRLFNMLGRRDYWRTCLLGLHRVRGDAMYAFNYDVGLGLCEACMRPDARAAEERFMRLYPQLRSQWMRVGSAFGQGFCHPEYFDYRAPAPAPPHSKTRGCVLV